MISPKANLLFCILVFFSMPFKAYSQAGSTEQGQVIDQAKSQLDFMATDDKGSLKEFCAKHDITGAFVFDMTIKEKGDVVTVFMVSHDGNNIQQKNFLKDKLHTLRFANIKLSKNERVKFRHSLQF